MIRTVSNYAAFLPGGCVRPRKELVDARILEGLSREFDRKDIVSSILDERVKILRDYYIKGYDLPVPDPAKVLGEGWKMGRKCGNDPSTHFELSGKNSVQILEFNSKDQTTTLVSSAKLNMINTWVQEITLDGNNKVTSTTQKLS